MSDLRTAAQRMLAAVEDSGHKADVTAAADDLRAALAQQAEPVQDRHRACPTHCCPVHGCKYMHDDCPVVSGAVQPVYPRNNGCESCADDAMAQQAEPVEPVATLGYARKIEVLITQRDVLLEALKAVEPLLASKVRKKVSAVIKAVEETK